MLKSLYARNVALLIGSVLIGQLLASAAFFLILVRPQTDRVAGILAGNVLAISSTLNGLPREQRQLLIDQINAQGSVRILKGNIAPPEDRGGPDILETIFMRSFAKKLEASNPIIWRGGKNGQLWLQIKMGDEYYWLSHERPAGVAPNRALPVSLAIAVLVALITGLLLQRRIAQPLKNIAAAADSFDRNALTPPLPEDGPTEISALSRSFNGMRSRLKDEDLRRSRMLAAISHDLRTPLAKLRLEIAMVPSIRPESEALIDRQFDRLDAMLNQFLDFGRGAESEAEVVFDLKPMLQLTIFDLGIKLEMSPSEPALVHARPVAMQRALVNIVNNALTYGAAPVTVRLERSGDNFIICVDDNGPGVSDAELAQLKESFFRSDTARSIASGSGLGLSIANSVAEQAGGKLMISNRATGGLLVQLILPKHTE